MANSRHWLLPFDEVAHEPDCILVAAQLVGVTDAARDEERVVVGRGSLLDRPVDLPLVGGREMVEALDLAWVDRDDLRRRACALERLPRLLEFDTLEHVGREDRDLLACELLLGHTRTSLVDSRPRSRAARPKTAGRGGTLCLRARSSGDRAADF